MNNDNLQNYLELDNSDKLIDIKLSLGNALSAPSEILDQVKDVISAYKEGILNEFIDY